VFGPLWVQDVQVYFRLVLLTPNPEFRSEAEFTVAKLKKFLLLATRRLALIRSASGRRWWTQATLCCVAEYHSDRRARRHWIASSSLVRRPCPS
jgi:hypothetical protein